MSAVDEEIKKGTAVTRAEQGDQEESARSSSDAGTRHPFAEASRLRVRYTISRRSGQVLGKGTILKIDKPLDYHQRLASAEHRGLTDSESASGDGPDSVAGPHGAPRFGQPSTFRTSVGGGLVRESSRTLDRSALRRSEDATTFATANDATLIDDTGLVLLHGAPSFRTTGDEEHIYGVGQPTVAGIRGIVSYISAAEFHGKVQGDLIWVNMREEPIIYVNGSPLALREADRPLRNISHYAGVDPTRLEEMEKRLKLDVLAEAERNNGLLLIHREMKDGRIVPVWAGISEDTVHTSAEVYASLKGKAKVHYYRVPVTPERSPERDDFQELLNILMSRPSDTPVVFNCHSGTGRSSVGMVVACLLRACRVKCAEGKPAHPNQLQRFRSLRSLVAVDGMAQHRMGEYQIILDLLRVLPGGIRTKRVVDEAIDRCAAFGNNLRESILLHRREAEKARTSAKAAILQNRARYYLERYFALLVLMSYIEEQFPLGFKADIDQWMHSHGETLTLLRAVHMDSPQELLRIANTDSQFSVLVASREGSVLSKYTILKHDHYPSNKLISVIPGAPNFRSSLNTALRVHGVAQPTGEGAASLIQSLLADDPSSRVLWINLREEPTIYLNGRPFVLRNVHSPLQNINLYTGIDPHDAEMMEERLKSDVLDEAVHFNGSILVHEENVKSKVEESWELLQTPVESSVHTTQELITGLAAKYDGRIKYARVPITPESAPEVRDFDDMVQLIAREPASTHIVFSCQMGRGRSTAGMLVASLIRQWVANPKRGPVFHKIKKTTDEGDFQAILSLMRVIAKGQRCKRQVDNEISKVAQTHHLVGAIHRAKHASEAARNDEEGKLKAARALHLLERYFYFIVFNAYCRDSAALLLDSRKICAASSASDPDGPPSPACSVEHMFHKSFADWLKDRGELGTILEHMQSDSSEDALKQLAPVELETASSVVANRRGDVLGPGTILKSDHFPGCQRKGFEAIPGAPNFRKVDGMNVYGVAIPKVSGVREVLNRLIGLDANGKPKKTTVIWTNLREEPLVYINDRPFVLRSASAPFSNLEYTGITASRVEQQEARLKEDLLAEAAANAGCALIHDETDDGSLQEHFEEVSPETVLTPKEVYESLVLEGYDVRYERLPITDEQAPEEGDFGVLLDKVEKATPDQHLVFNCQMGRGRTTTGMVVACLVMTRNDPKWKAGNSLRLSLPGSPGMVHAIAATPSVNYHMGEFQCILRLIRVLPNGSLIKAHVDHCIDHCGRMQNLREAMISCKEAAAESTRPSQRRHLLTRGHAYLARYFYLITFTAHLHTDTLPSSSSDSEASTSAADSASASTASSESFSPRSFTAWMKQHREVYHLLNNITLD